jgi:peptidylprolyl isomerase
VRPLLPRLAAILAVPTLLVAGCASEGTPNASATPSGSASAAPSAAGVEASKALADVKVSGAANAKPTVTLPQMPTALSTSGARVLTPGTGAVVTKGQKVTVNYVLLNGKDGKEADTTYDKTPATFLADPGQLLPGLANGMIGQKIGSRVLVGVAPKDGFAGGAGNEQLGFSASDALIFVLDIKSATTPPKPLAGPDGTAVPPVAGLPTVTDQDGVPTITAPKTTPPTKLVVQPLIKGKGAKVTSGQTLTADYVGVVWADNRVFDSSFKEGGQKLELPIGVGQLVPGFDAGIVGQTVGSRVLLVLPPDQGYGAGGNEGAKIKGTDTLVFVVDILAAS